MMRIFLFVLLFAGVTYARLGENETQCNGRYGTPLTDKYTTEANRKNPLVPGGYTKSYNYQGWVVRVGYVVFNGPAIKMSFRKKAGGSIKEDELAAILTANAPEGMKWERGVYTNSPLQGSAAVFSNIGSNVMGAAAWKRTDGVVAILEPMKLELTLESPAAIEITRKAKDSAEAQRKAAIPAF